MGPQWFVTQAGQALGVRLRSVVLYGSAAAGDFIEGKSLYDLLVVVSPLGIEELDALGGPIRQWAKNGQPLPLLFSPEKLASSADAFAMEFLDMQQSRRVLFGDDPIASLSIDPVHVRHALERELKGKALALRDQYVIAAGNRRLILDLMADALPTFLILFRTTLRLFEPHVPAIKVEALQHLARHIPFDPQPFLTVQQFLDGRRGTSRVDSLALFRGYLSGIETIIHHVDQLLHPAHSRPSREHSGLVV
jgi:hypothetical protein